MPQVPESPRRGSQTASAGGNPVKNDPAMMVLMDRLDLVDEYGEFENWKVEFLERFESFLGESGSAEALMAYEHFRETNMEKVVKKVKRLSDYREMGDLSVERVSVRARNAMNEVSVVLIDTGKAVSGLVPPTSSDEDRVGYTKYHIGAVLVRDGFQEYERMQMCKDAMEKLTEECVEEIGDEKLLDANKKYKDEVKRFVSIMEDLGLYKILQKEREFDPLERAKKPKEKEEPICTVEKPTTPTRPLIPELPFDDEEETKEEKPDEEKPKEEPEMVESPQSKRSSRTDYEVRGSWGGTSMDFGDKRGRSSPSKHLRVKQDLADSSNRAPLSPRKTKKPDQVFVTPARNHKKVAKITIDNPGSGSGQVGSPPNFDDEDAGSVADGSVAGSVGDQSFTPETARILEHDTPKTRKAKLEWKTVKSSKAKRRGSGSSKASTSKPKSEKAKGEKPRGPKLPPRPSVTKELTTKTQDKSWNMPMASDEDANSVLSRSRPPTPKKSSQQSSDDGASVMSTATEGSIGPGIKVRRVSRIKKRPAKESTASTEVLQTQENPRVVDVKMVDGKTNLSIEVDADEVAINAADDELKVPSSPEQVISKEVETTHDAANVTPTQVINITKEHHHANVANVTHMTTAEPAEAQKDLVDQIVHEITRSSHVTEHSGPEVFQSTVAHRKYIAGADWIGVVPLEVDDKSVEHHYVDRPEVRRSSYIRMLTFCSIDDTIDPRLLGIVAQCYPLVEFAVLMHQEMAGQPRYASPQWVQRLALVQAKMRGKMNLSAHLYGSLVEEVFSGNDGFLTRLSEMNFRRVQLNATSINGVNTHGINKYVDMVLAVAEKHPDLEITIQLNDETRPLWQGILGAGDVPKNVTFLFDASMGRGQVPEFWSPAPKDYGVGYAGGIGLGGPAMTKRILKEILSTSNHQAVWVSMESSMRCTKNGKDVFDLEKCYEIIDVAHQCNIHLHPSFIQ